MVTPMSPIPNTSCGPLEIDSAADFHISLSYMHSQLEKFYSNVTNMLVVKIVPELYMI